MHARDGHGTRWQRALAIAIMVLATLAAGCAMELEEGVSSEAARRQCSDQIDNDGDSLIDYPADPGCTSRHDGTENDGTPGDTTGPTVSLTAPTAGATISGTVTLRASASDASGVAYCSFYVDALPAIRDPDSAAPWELAYDTRPLSNGAHTFRAQCVDGAGNVGVSPTVSAIVQNDALSNVPLTGITLYASGPVLTIPHITDFDWINCTIYRCYTANPSIIPTIKASNPHAKITTYVEPDAALDSCTANQDTCGTAFSLGEVQAHDAANPGDPWLLRDSAGNPINYTFYPDAWVVDVGSASYQAAWLRRMTERLARYPAFDGIFADNILGSWSGISARLPVKYPTNYDWAAPMLSFVRNALRPLRDAGNYVVTNTGMSSENTCARPCAWYDQVAPNVSAALSEYWLQSAATPPQLYNTDPTVYWGNFASYSLLPDHAQGAGASFYGHVRSSDPAHAVYLKAAFLMRWNGNPAAGGIAVWGAGMPPWDAENWSEYLGLPLGPMLTVGVGQRRSFVRGTALINPSHNTSQTFALGATYLKADGTPVSSVTLAPTSAMILTNP